MNESYVKNVDIRLLGIGLASIASDLFSPTKVRLSKGSIYRPQPEKNKSLLFVID